LLDLSLPDSHGLETFERARLEAPSVPIIVLTGFSDENMAVSAVDAGAQDYLVKGRVDGESLVRAIRYARERHENMTELRQLALVDELTGLRNRRGFMTLGEQALKSSDRSGIPLALVFVDVNEMKAINDELGHHEGDRALQDVAEVLRLTFRESDILARVGGDEFCALITMATDKSPHIAVERIDRNLGELHASRERPYRLTLSVGAYAYDPEKPCSLEELMEQADRLMYRQKMGAERRRRLLVVDDDASLRSLAEVIFGDEYDVVTASTAHQAIALATEGHFDLFLFDVRLPDLEGMDLARKMRSDPRTSRVPIIFMTGLDDVSIEVQGLRLGVDDFVHKPFNADVLLSRVENAIARAKRR
jgi:diguanylate cyclase (GGDEF)-like protein